MTDALEDHEGTVSIGCSTISNSHIHNNYENSPLLKSPKGRVKVAGVADDTTLVCMTVCIGVGKQLHTPPSHRTFGEPQS